MFKNQPLEDLANNQPLKVAVLIDKNLVSKYVYDICYFLKNNTNFELSLIIQENKKNYNNFKKIFSKDLLKLLSDFSFIILINIENLFLKRHKFHKDHFHKFDLFKLTNNFFYIKPIISNSNLIYTYSESDIKKISTKNFDVIIRCGSGILHGEILKIPKYGIFSFHHGNNNVNRGGPPGFWEVYNREDTTGFTIQQLTEELDGGNVLYRGFFKTKNYYLLNQANLYNKSNFYMKKILLDLVKFNKIPKMIESLPYCYILYKKPSFLRQINYLLKTIILFSNKLIRKIFNSKNDFWCVAYNFAYWRNLTMWRSTTINNPKNHYLADPFIISTDNNHFCFVEDFDYNKMRGSISLYQLKENQYIRHGTIISEEFHLSYPYIFNYDSKFYLVPESSKNKDIRLYEAVDFPYKWKFLKVIFSNIDAADTTIFQKDNLWWLFTNIDPLNSGDHDSELFIYYSNDPLSNDWHEHPKNPIICDASIARMGGILIESDSIYRVSQKQKFNKYGVSSNIFKIIKLSTTDYIEELQHQVEPKFFKDLIGTHHLHGNNFVTVFDYLKK